LEGDERIGPSDESVPGVEVVKKIALAVCNLALRTYQQEPLPQLEAFGARLVAISPQPPDESLSTVEKAALEFTVLSDPGSRLADRLGIAFEQTDDVLAAGSRTARPFALSIRRPFPIAPR
jgi:peroxiredoxin